MRSASTPAKACKAAELCDHATRSIAGCEASCLRHPHCCSAVRAAAAAIDAWQASASQAALAHQSLAACDILGGCSGLALRLKLGGTVTKQLCRSIVKQLAYGRAALVHGGESGGASPEAGLDMLAALAVQAQAQAVCWAVALVQQHGALQHTALLPPAALVGWLRDTAPLLARLDGSPAAGRVPPVRALCNISLHLRRHACIRC